MILPCFTKLPARFKQVTWQAENLHKLMDHRLQKVPPKELKGMYSEVAKLAVELRHELPGYKASTTASIYIMDLIK